MWIRINQTQSRLFWMRWLMVVCFVTGQTPLLPAGVGAVLWMEGTHAIELQGGGNQSRVTLHHITPPRWLTTPHQHGWVSRLLVTGAAPTGGSHPDHLLEFDSEFTEPPASSTGVDRPGLSGPGLCPAVRAATSAELLRFPSASRRGGGLLHPKPPLPVGWCTIVLRV